MANYHAQQISVNLNNALVLLWQQGHIESATAKIEFKPVNDTNDPRVELARSGGLALYRLESDDERLAFHFTDCAPFWIPRSEIGVIGLEIMEARADVLQEMAKIHESMMDDSEEEEDDWDDDDVKPQRREAELPSLGPDDE